MSTEQGLRVVSIVAGADLSAAQYLAVAIATDNSGVKSVSSDGGRVDGFLQNAPASGQPASVAIGGITKAIVGAGGVATAGLALKSGNDGKVVASGSGKYTCGISLDAGVSGDVIRVLIASPFLAP
jgi:hypothetical protein